MMEYLSVTAQQLLPILGAFLAAFVVHLVSRAIKAVEKKFDIDLDNDLEKRALGLVRSGVVYAEQWAINKTRTEGTKPSGASKLEEALVFVRAEAERAGLATWVEARGSDLAKVVEAQLGKVFK